MTTEREALIETLRTLRDRAAEWVAEADNVKTLDAAIAALAAPVADHDAAFAAKDNAKASEAACLAMIVRGYAWNGSAWYLPETQLPTNTTAGPPRPC